MIVILGANGYIGSAFCRYLKDKVEIATIPRVTYYDVDMLSTLLRSIRPEFLINCAGYTGKPNVDACEANKTECLHANAVLPGIIARACSFAEVPWGHVSSGCIYQGKCRNPDGSGERPWKEDDDPNFCFTAPPCSFYSGTKALGEELIMNEWDRIGICYMWRLRIPFNEVNSERNYISKVLRYEKLLDVENSLCHLDEYIRACWECWTIKAPFGIYNMNNGGSVTTREVTEMALRHGIIDKEFDFFEDECHFLGTVRTPRSSCVLDNTKALQAGIHLRPVREALAEAMENWQSK
jgi:dTDP-4-dehydrorhamnose reductase